MVLSTKRRKFGELRGGTSRVKSSIVQSPGIRHGFGKSPHGTGCMNVLAESVGDRGTAGGGIRKN